MFIKLIIIIKFALGGGFASLIYYGLLYSLTEYAKIFYIFSFLLAYGVSIIVGFYIKKYWVFKNSLFSKVKKQLQQYIVLSICNFTANGILLWLLVEYILWHYIYSQVFITLLLVGLNYIICKKIFIVKPSD